NGRPPLGRAAPFPLTSCGLREFAVLMMPISSPFLRSSILLSLLSGATLSSPAAVAQASHDAPSPPQASPPAASPPAADEAGSASPSTQEVAEVVVTVERPPGESLRATHAGSV